MYFVNPSTHFYHRVAAPRASVSFNFIPVTKAFHDISKNFEEHDAGIFTFLQGKATLLGTTQHTVTIYHSGVEKCKQTELACHALILATGTRAHSSILSLEGGGHEVVIEALLNLDVELAYAKSVVVASGGPSGVEFSERLASS